MITLVHELGHGLAAILTGGSFLYFEVFPNGGGLAHTSGGLRFVVIPAGYLGAKDMQRAVVLAEEMDLHLVQ